MRTSLLADNRRNRSPLQLKHETDTGQLAISPLSPIHRLSLPAHEPKFECSSSSIACEWCRQRPDLILDELDKVDELEAHRRTTKPREDTVGPRVYHVKSRTLDNDSNEGNATTTRNGAKQIKTSSLGTLIRCPVLSCEMEFTSHNSLAHHNICQHMDPHCSAETKTSTKAEAPTILSHLNIDRKSDLENWRNYVDEAGEGEEVKSASDSENNELGNLLNEKNSSITTSLYGTSVPTSNFFASMSSRGSLGSPLASYKKGSLGPASPSSFQTAQSSLASYTTAPSGSQPRWQIGDIRAVRQSKLHLRSYSSAEQSPSTLRVTPASCEGFLEVVLALTLNHFSPSGEFHGSWQWVRTEFEDIIREELLPTNDMSSNTSYGILLKGKIEMLVINLVNQLLEFTGWPLRGFNSDTQQPGTRLRADISKIVFNFLEGRTPSLDVITTEEVFSSKWLMYLYDKVILLDRSQELNWSGRGQHVEYGPKEAKSIPLTYERTLGHSQTAIVDSVRCRRIRLARKKITCDQHLKKEDAIVEVERLLRLQHSHVVRIIGTYTFEKELAILLYPAAEWDLDKYMDVLLEGPTKDCPVEPHARPSAQALMSFIGCLSEALDFIHGKNVKHMDIKPKNLLVHQRSGKGHKIYVADFGIARSYTSAADAETDSPTSFTRAYAAPEVVHQDKRGFSADVFSLGCVFIEMMATLKSCMTGVGDERQRLLDLRKAESGNSSFYANIGVVTRWYEETISFRLPNHNDSSHWNPGFSRMPNKVVDVIPKMIAPIPDSRPLASTLQEITGCLWCSECYDGPEPFEAAD